MSKSDRPVFVFGSNLAGRHGKGAALHAAKKFGAIRGIGEGKAGHSYAIPTKDARLRARSWEEIEASVLLFLDYARGEGANETFELTPAGCGLAGHSAKDLWAVLQREGLPANVFLSASWVNDHFNN